MDGKRKKLKIASELDSNLATSRIGRIGIISDAGSTFRM